MLKVVDQQGREIAGSKINVPNVGAYATGTMVNMPAGQQVVSIAPGFSGKPGDFGGLTRNETVDILAGTSSLLLKWIISPVKINIVDQNGDPGYSIIQGVMNDYLLSPYTVNLPVTDKSVYPATYGGYSKGYTLRSPDFLKQSEQFKVSDRPLTIERAWNNPYYPGNGLIAGRFVKILENHEVDKPLKKKNGTPILPFEVPNLYGSPEGFTIFDDGVDVCSKEYARLRGFDGPLVPVYQDLSVGWPKPQVRSGKLAIDPTLGRFALFSGNYPQKSLVISGGLAYTGFAVPGNGEVKVQGDYAYIAPGEGNFQVIDIKDKKTPRVVGHFNAGFNYNPELYKDVAYLVRKSVFSVDISHPDDPKWLEGSVPWTPPSGWAVKIVIHNGYAFVASMRSNIGLYVLDISDPGKLKVLASLDIGDPQGCGDLFIEGNRAYVTVPGRHADFSAPKGGGVIAIDIRNPLKPKVLGSYKGEPGDDVYDTPYLIGHKGNIMVMTSDWRPENYPPAKPGRLILVDMSDPARPVRRGVYTFVDRHGKSMNNVKLKDCVAKDGCIYVTDCNYDYNQDTMSRNNPPTHLFTFDISDPDNPLLLQQFSQKPARYMYVSCYGNYLFVNDYNYGVRIFDVSVAQKPVYSGGTVTAGEGRWSWTNEDETRAYISQTFGGAIFCADITKAANPAIIGTQYWDGEYVQNQIKGKDNTLYVPQMYSVSVVDFSNRSNPVKVRELPGLPAGYILPQIDVAGDRLYAAVRDPSNSNNKLIIYDISNSNSPIVTSNTVIGTGSHTPKVCVKGKYAYVMCGDKGKLSVFDISNPSNPAQRGQLDDNRLKINFGSAYGGDITVSGNTLYILSGLAGDTTPFYIVDVTNPGNPSFIKAHNDRFAHNDPESLLAYRDFLILDDYSSLDIYDIKNRKNPVCLDNTVSTGGVASWNLGNVRGTNLYYSTLDGLKNAALPAPSEGLKGNVTVHANIK